MLVDDVTITAIAGDGGDGAVHFGDGRSHIGPDGVSGGKGGSIILEAVQDLSALKRYRSQKVFKAKPGADGRGKFRDGKGGEDIVLPVPRGTVIHKPSLEMIELLEVGDQYEIAAGGRGGRGNFHFRSSTNTAPRQFENGRPGQEIKVRLELKLIADVGFVGLPNVGKSSLLNELTRAQSKVANYHFTTLEPHLGAWYDLIFADIPGIIEGASEGKGLGIKFLRHIERTRTILHFVDAESENPAEDYQTIRKELEAYSSTLMRKPERVLLSKVDLIEDKELLEKKKKELEAVCGSEVTLLSVYDDDTIKNVERILIQLTHDKKKQKETKTIKEEDAE